jgi:transposase InsO family protein
VIDDAGVFNGKIKEWEHYYNYDRPHSDLGGQTPYERLRQKQLQSDPSVTSLRQVHIDLGSK